jgi:hypothetical protein
MGGWYWQSVLSKALKVKLNGLLNEFENFLLRLTSRNTTR